MKTNSFRIKDKSVRGAANVCNIASKENSLINVIIYIKIKVRADKVYRF